MIVNMLAEATKEQIDHVVERIKECGFQAHLIHGEERTVIGIVGNSNKRRPELEALRAAPGVEELVPISHPFKLAARSCRPEGSILDLGKGVTIGGMEVVVAAGPCAVESAEQIFEHRGRSVARAGAKLLPRRGRVQTAEFAVQFPGHGRGRIEVDACGGG